MRLFRRQNLNDLYLKYTGNRSAFESDIFASIPYEKMKFKAQILSFFDQAIQNSDSRKLAFCIAAASQDGIDMDYVQHFEKIILAEWHQEHEDIVDIVYSFKDDRFSHALFEIAIHRSKYRKFDLENESTLRKCIHALKAINSKNSNMILEKLKEDKNPNIDFVLELYPE